MNEEKNSEKSLSVKIAKELGYSQATVSRVLRHCSAVDSDTRRQILSSLDPADAFPASECDIYVILPDTPRYFWEKVRKGTILAENDPLVSIKHNIYTNVRDEDVILHYLDEAKAMRAKVVIIAAVMTPVIRERLLDLQKNTAIFLLSEGGELVNSFYFGADSYEDGFKLGSLFLERYSHMTPVLVSVENNYNVRKRMEGFTDALRKHDEERFRTVPQITIHYTTAADPKLFPSKIASLLAEVMEAGRSYCLYVPFGNANLSRILQKAKCGGRLICLGHDCMIGEDGRPEKGIAAAVKQDTAGQGEAAVRAAIRYVKSGVFPGRKYNCVPSVICEDIGK